MLITLTGCSQNENSMFLDKILNDFSRNSYFVLINVTSSKGMSLFAIENDDLFYYFHQTKKVTEDEYKKKLLVLLTSKQSLNLDDEEIKKYGFIEVVQNMVIKEISERGKKIFFNKYFTNCLLKEEIANIDKPYIIKVLYDWNIASRIDDETGYLMIDNGQDQ